MKRRLLVSLCLLTVTGLSGAGILALRGHGGTRTDSTAGGKSGQQEVAVRSIRLQRLPRYSRPRRFTGIVVVNRTSDLGFEMTSRVVRVFVEAGDSVRSGQILAKLGTAKLNAMRRKTAADLAAAIAELNELRAGQRSEVKRIAKANVAELEAKLKNSEGRVARVKAARELDAATIDALNDVIALRDTLRARLSAARARRDEINAGPRREKIAAKAAQVKSLQASLDEVEARIKEAILKAPFAGTIGKRFVHEGTIVSPGQSAFRILETGRLEVHVGLPVATASRIQSGAEFAITIAGKACNASLKALLPELNATTRTRSAIFRLAGAGRHPVVSGQLADVRITEVTEEPGFWLPTGALVKGIRGLWSCFVITQQRKPGSENRSLRPVERRDVEVLSTDGHYVFVRGTISDGEEVVAGGTHRIVPGQLVRVIDQPIMKKPAGADGSHR